MSAALHDDLADLTCALMRFESTAERPDQLAAVVDYAAAYLADIPGLFIERSQAGAKPALVVTLRETRKPALMLNGHLDVVLARPEQFVPVIRDGRIYGRGSQDMKGSCAVMLRLIRDLAALPVRPDVGFQLVSDEEIGGALGTGRLLEAGWRCDFMLCLEPTDMNVLFAHKGALWIEVRLHGRPAHGSRPWEGHNPISTLVRGLAELEARYPLPAPGAWRTTITPTQIHVGAGSRNQVPASVSLTLDIRHTAEETPAQIYALLEALFPDAELTLLSSGAPLYTDPATPAVARTASLIERRIGRAPTFFREHYSTDARYYTNAGIPAVCVGPVGAGLHSDEEWVSIDSLVDLYTVLSDYIHSSTI